jgi:hypothetical protein
MHIGRLGAILSNTATEPVPSCFCPAHTALASFEMPEQSKRKHEEGLDPEEFTAGLCNLIRQTTSQGFGEFILDMVQNENLALEDLEPLTEKLPSFLESEWWKVALSFGLDPTIDKYQLRPFSTPHAHLPPSFHKQVMNDSIQWLDVYLERGSQKGGAARVRLMDAVCLTNGSLLYGLTFPSVARPSVCPFQRPRG